MSNVLVGQTNAGQFVHDTQGTAKAEGFNSVSRLWYPKTTDFSVGMEALEKGIESREDITVAFSQVSAMVDDNSRLALAFEDGREFVPNSHALKQLATRIGLPQTTVNHLTVNWTDIEDKILLRNLINRGITRFNQNEKADEHKFIFRTYNDATCRAVLTDSFAVIDNRWYLDLLAKAIPGGRLSHWRGDADEIFGNVLIPDSIRVEDDSDYGGMISIGNSEIGTRRIEQYPSLFRAICMNGCIWDQEKGETFSQVHRGKIDLQMLAKRIVRNLDEQIPLLPSIIDKVLSLRMKEFGLGTVKVPQIYAALADRFNLTPKQALGSNTAFVKHESGNRNLFGVIQGLTRQSQLESNDSWVTIDRLAGKLSQWDAASWSNFRTAAGTYSDEQVTKSLGLAVAV